MPFIIGTAGHIDHGKTTLIKALTGRSTDRLKEEIKRGISINLGFTYFELPGVGTAGIIDVPGHERFIKNMIAGAAGIDLVLVTVDANEGIMPQTLEHLDILSFLNIRAAIFVLTKAGIADELMLELAKDDIESLKARNPEAFYANAEVIPVDSLSGLGMDELVQKLCELAKTIKPHNEKAPARLPVDRVFTMKGFGTVVTGTLWEGIIKVGDNLRLYGHGRTEQGQQVKIRGIQVHEQAVDQALAGSRTALNLTGVKQEDLRRGDWLSAKDMAVSELIDVRLRLLPDATPVKLFTRVRLYLGADEVMCRVIPLDKNELGSGETGLCQLRMEGAISSKSGDPFVIRSYSPMTTIGGGVILDPAAKKHKRLDEAVLMSLELREEGSPAQILEDFVQNAKTPPTKQLAQSSLGLSDGDFGAAFTELVNQEILFDLGGFLFHQIQAEQHRDELVNLLSQFHQKRPLRAGLSKDEIARSQKLPGAAVLPLMALWNDLFTTAGDIVCLYGFNPSYGEKEMAVWTDMETKLRNAGFDPVEVTELAKGQLESDIVEDQSGKGLVKLDGQHIIHADFYEKAKQGLFDLFKDSSQIALAQFRDKLGVSRRGALLYLEHFDRARITVRDGDLRRLSREYQ